MFLFCLERIVCFQRFFFSNKENGFGFVSEVIGLVSCQRSLCVVIKEFFSVFFFFSTRLIFRFLKDICFFFKRFDFFKMGLSFFFFKWCLNFLFSKRGLFSFSKGFVFSMGLVDFLLNVFFCKRVCFF